MAMASFGSRAREFVRLMDLEPPCSCQQEAHDQIQQCWIQANLNLGVPSHFLQRVAEGGFLAKDGWVGIGTRVATWETMGDALFRIFLHDDGAIVIQYGPGTQLQLIYSKPGASRLAGR